MSPVLPISVKKPSRTEIQRKESIMSKDPQYNEKENTVTFSVDDLKELSDRINEAMKEENKDLEKGRTRYCCRYQDGHTHNTKGWTHVDAMADCIGHRPGVPVSVSKGPC
jgi:membrane-associated HD superfamily phosphohydrolase